MAMILFFCIIIFLHYSHRRYLYVLLSAKHLCTTVFTLHRCCMASTKPL